MYYQIPISIYICTSDQFVQNVNNYVIFVPHEPIYWSERINKVEVELRLIASFCSVNVPC